MKLFSPARFLFPIFFLFSDCLQSQDDLFYQAQEGNQKIVTAYSLKNASCGANRLPASLILGRAKKSDLDLCIKAIELTDCMKWNDGYPLSETCVSITTLNFN
ncbi:hypothetical protein P3G55_12720 [Leptospira sp. 96542]|nr:hypothetical protein [Leptospira sp. 96542]